MAVSNGAIDVTPPWSISTIQSSSEWANTLITSIIIVFILANFNSMVQKLVTLTHRNHFRYSSYIRAYIFNASADLVSLFSWIFGHNSFLQDEWNTTKKRRSWGRLWCPVFARMLILIASIGSIFLALPGERVFRNCPNGDFTPFVNFSNVEGESGNPKTFNSLCVKLRLATRRGELDTALSLCSQVLYDYPDDTTRPNDPQVLNAVSMTYSKDTAEITTVFRSKGFQRGVRSYVEWTFEDQKLRSIFKPEYFDLEDHWKLALGAIQKESAGCGQATNDRLNSTESTAGKEHTGVRETTCEFDVNAATQWMQHMFREKLSWRQMKGKLERRLVEETGARSVLKVCPYKVKVIRPIVNVVPLSVGLIFVFTINMAVGFSVGEQGNVDDASFHLVKEVVDVDVTCNPLQRGENEATDEDADRKIPMNVFYSGDGRSAHVGFLMGPDDKRVCTDREPPPLGRCTSAYRRLFDGNDSNIP